MIILYQDHSNEFRSLFVKWQAVILE